MILADYLKDCHKAKISDISLFFDIETFTYNKLAGYKNPSEYKHQVFSVCVGWVVNHVVHYEDFTTFKDFLTVCENEKLPKSTKITLYAHNSNRYDNHFLLSELLYNYPELKEHHYPMYLPQATDNQDTQTLKRLNQSPRFVLEKRVKSKTNLELVFRLSKVRYQTRDTFNISGNLALGKIGDRMYKMGLIAEDNLKTTLDYEKYDDFQDHPRWEMIDKAKSIHNNLTVDELTYIHNDIILLATFWDNYGKINVGFDKEKITFSQNVMAEYLTTPLATYQIKNQFNETRLKYTNYVFQNENYFDYLKHYYKGGLNFYNDQYINKIINSKIISYDLNSSYPNVMYNFKIPTFSDAIAYGYGSIPINTLADDNIYYLYEVDINEFNRLINLVPSTLIKKLLVKYYTSPNKHVYINSNTLRLIELFSKQRIEQITVYSWQRWQCVYFGAREVIATNYETKTKGKSDNAVVMHSPSNVEILPQPNPDKFSKEEVLKSKVVLNGLYGLPALRPFYNLFKYNPYTRDFDSVPNGFQNSERNQIFSIFITSQALYNLLELLKDVPAKMIDKYVYYGDTDSLYIDGKIDKYIDKSMVNPLNLGAWDNEHVMDKFFILNHKKYAYHDIKEGNGFRAGGVPEKNFNTNMPFDEFIATQFSAGVHIKATRSYLTKMETVAIYDADMELDKGGKYRDQMSELDADMVGILFDKIRHDEKSQESDDALYIETPVGSFGLNDIHQTTHDTENSSDIQNFINMSQIMRKNLGK